MDASEFQRLKLADFENLYRPSPIRSLRRRVMEFDGLNNLLTRTHPGDPIRDAVVARLRYECFMEIAAQAGVIPRELPRDEDMVADLFSPSDTDSRLSSVHWLPLLYAVRVSGRNDYTLSWREPEGFSCMFSAFECLDVAVRDDPDLQEFAEAISLPTFESGERFLAPFDSPENFLAALSPAAPESVLRPILNDVLTRIPSGATAPLRQRLWRYRSNRLRRSLRTASGLRRFFLLCPELAGLLSDNEWPDHFRAAVWQYYVAWFDQFSPRKGFMRGLDLVQMTLEHLTGWNQAETPQHADEFDEVRYNLQRYSRAFEVLRHTDYPVPSEWHAVVRNFRSLPV